MCLRNISIIFLFLISITFISAKSWGLPPCPSSGYKHNCIGTYIWKEKKYNGIKYVGEYQNGKIHGHGILTYPNGEKYEGEFKFQKRDGLGVTTWSKGKAKGQKYIGQYRNDKKNGQGEYTFPSGEKYKGQFQDDKYNGKGVLIFSNGDKYEGDFVDNKYNGKGMFIFSNGEKYEGDFADGKYNGKGILVYPNGEKYEGDFVDGNYSGKGILIFSNGERYEGDFLDSKYNGKGILTFPNGHKYKGDFADGKYNGKGIFTQKNGLFKEGIWKNNKFLYSQKIKKLKKNYADVAKPKITSRELEAERQKRLQLERELTQLKNKQKQEQLRINTDNQKPTINAFSKLNGSNAIISGRVTDNIEVVEVLVDGQVQKLKSNGTFETDFYIPRGGKTIEIVAYDTKGNKASKVLKLERGNIQQASGPTFDTLNPLVKKVKSNPNALALIIGISDYSKTKANAVYADKDAQQFYDYATMKLGIPARNIKELVNNKADRVEIGLAIQDWIARSTKQGKTDIYIFFAGHGLASQDGKDMFLLPYDGSPRLLKASAIRRKELFANIQQANPRSVTVFLDTCYSGVTRNEEMLIAGRPIVIKAKEQAIPDGFTLFSAASNEQISRPLEEAKHGMFSYFLMKGMEGDADVNNDNKITARELHAYVEQNVVQQSSGSQTPELQGDKDRVLVQFN